MLIHSFDKTNKFITYKFRIYFHEMQYGFFIPSRLKNLSLIPLRIFCLFQCPAATVITEIQSAGRVTWLRPILRLRSSLAEVPRHITNDSAPKGQKSQICSFARSRYIVINIMAVGGAEYIAWLPEESVASPRFLLVAPLQLCKQVTCTGRNSACVEPCVISVHRLVSSWPADRFGI